VLVILKKEEKMLIKKFITVAIILLVMSQIAMAKEKKDPFDLSATDKKIEELGVPTASEVRALEEKAKEFYAKMDWKNAVSALEEYAKKANWLSNLISAGMKPFYNADYDKRKKFPYSKLQLLIPLEKEANDYRQKRNRAIVMQAECLVKLGEKGKAVSLLVRALDLIDIKDDEWWNRARKQLYKLIELE